MRTPSLSILAVVAGVFVSCHAVAPQVEDRHIEDARPVRILEPPGFPGISSATIRAASRTATQPEGSDKATDYFLSHLALQAERRVILHVDCIFRSSLNR